MTLQIMQLLSAAFGLVGGVILAFSINGMMRETRLGIELLSTSIQTVVSRGNVYVFTGIEERFKKASRIANSWVRAGLYCMVTSAVLASLAVLGIAI